MIISASRRTDIPAFYPEWFIRRIRAGFCTVPNPFNPQQVSRVSLDPQDVDVVVFWTRNPRPLFPHLDELDRRGFRYYFQFTLLNHPRQLEPKALPLDASLQAFHQLAERVGAARVIWRYDPIVITPQTQAVFHLQTYQSIARALQGAALRSVVSLVDDYPKLRKRQKALAGQGMGWQAVAEPFPQEVGDMLRGMAEAAQAHGMEIASCAEPFDLRPYGIAPGKCVDDGYILRTFGLQVSQSKDPSQRPACGCVLSKDIGMYDTCPFGCQYCYASNPERARQNYAAHDPDASSLLGEPIPKS